MIVTREDAARLYGPKFVNEMMGQKNEIEVTPQQDRDLRIQRAIRWGNYLPYGLAFTYIVADAHGSTKVGFSRNVQRRVAGMQTSHAHEIVCRWAFGFRDSEQALMLERQTIYALKDMGAHVSGEWFSIPSDTVKDVMFKVAAARRLEAMKLEVAKSNGEVSERIFRAIYDGTPDRIRYMLEAKRNLLWVIDQISKPMG